MFSTLESSWDHSAHRGWSAFASFTFQVMALSLFLVIPMFIVQGPPTLHWLEHSTAPLPTPPAPITRPAQTPRGNFVTSVLQTPAEIPRHIMPSHGDEPINPPALPHGIQIGIGIGPAIGIIASIGTASPPVMVKPAAPQHPLKISHWAEGNLIYRVQPVYPPLARQARIQGAVQLRAVVGKNGTIQNLAVVSGHPMLAGSAIEAVRQWRYRPYLLNDEPIEIETEITVNFVLSGN